MEGQRLVADPGLGQRRHQPRREVQRGGRRGDRAFLAREHRLIIVAVARVGRAPAGDIGRQRHPAGALEQQLDRLLAVEGQQDAAVLAALVGDRGDAGAEIDPVAVAQPLGVADEGAPGARPLALVQGRADPRLAAPALELGGDDPGVVEHQQVAGAQQAPAGRATTMIGERRRADLQQPRAIARACGPQRDPVGRQLEVEKVDAHAATSRPLSCACGAAPARLRRGRGVGGGRRSAAAGAERCRGGGRRCGGRGGERPLHRRRDCSAVSGGTLSEPSEARTIRVGVAGGSPRSIAST